MPQVLGNTTVGDGYPATNQSGGAILGYSNDVFQQGYVFIANNPVFLKYLRGNQGQMQESAELYLAPGYYPLIGGASSGIGYIGGFKMRNAVAGSAAQAAGALFYPGEAQLGTGQPFSGTVSASGGITPPSSGLQLIADQLLTGAAASFDTQTILGGNIPQTFKHLRMLLDVRGDTALEDTLVQLRLNNDSGANYDVQTLTAEGGAVSTGSSEAATFATIAALPAANAVGSQAAAVSTDLLDYTGTTFFKQFTSASGFRGTAAGGHTFYIPAWGQWRSTGAITRITVFPTAGNLVAGSRFSLYGYP